MDVRLRMLQMKHPVGGLCRVWLGVSGRLHQAEVAILLLNNSIASSLTNPPWYLIWHPEGSRSKYRRDASLTTDQIHCHHFSPYPLGALFDQGHVVQA